MLAFLTFEWSSYYFSSILKKKRLNSLLLINNYIIKIKLAERIK